MMAYLAFDPCSDVHIVRRSSNQRESDIFAMGFSPSQAYPMHTLCTNTYQIERIHFCELRVQCLLMLTHHDEEERHLLYGLHSRSLKRCM